MDAEEKIDVKDPWRQESQAKNSVMAKEVQVKQDDNCIQVKFLQSREQA